MLHSQGGKNEQLVTKLIQGLNWFSFWGNLFIYFFFLLGVPIIALTVKQLETIVEQLQAKQASIDQKFDNLLSTIAKLSGIVAQLLATVTQHMSRIDDVLLRMMCTPLLLPPIKIQWPDYQAMSQSHKRVRKNCIVMTIHPYLLLIVQLPHLPLNRNNDLPPLNLPTLTIPLLVRTSTFTTSIGLVPGNFKKSLLVFILPVLLHNYLSKSCTEREMSKPISPTLPPE